MKTYHYHQETGAYLGEGEADTSPLEPGAWLIPANATTDTPPAPQDGKDLFNVAGSWVLRDKPAPEPEAPPAPVPTGAEQRAAEIRGRLNRIDELSARPARAVALELAQGGAPDAGDVERLAFLDAEANTLREELAEL